MKMHNKSYDDEKVENRFVYVNHNFKSFIKDDRQKAGFRSIQDY